MKKLITTLVSSNDYMLGAIALHISLQKYNPDIDYCVMITNNIIDTSLLEKYNIQYKKFPYLTSSANNFTTDYINKFYAFSFIDYDKVLFFDADIIVFGDISYLFNYPTNPINTFCVGGTNNLLYNEDKIIIPDRSRGWIHFTYVMLFKPSISNMHIYLNEMKNKYWCDEEFLNNYLGDCCCDIKLCRNWYHDHWSPKWWTLFNFEDNDLFYYFCSNFIDTVQLLSHSFYKESRVIHEQNFFNFFSADLVKKLNEWYVFYIKYLSKKLLIININNSNNLEKIKNLNLSHFQLVFISNNQKINIKTLPKTNIVFFINDYDLLKIKSNLNFELSKFKNRYLVLENNFQYWQNILNENNCNILLSKISLD